MLLELASYLIMQIHSGAKRNHAFTLKQRRLWAEEEEEEKRADRKKDPGNKGG